MNSPAHQPELIVAAACGLAALPLSFVLTAVVLRVASAVGLLDAPNARSSHDTPTPRGGGLAVVLSVLAGLSALYVNEILEAREFYALLVGGAVVAGVGLLDDRWNLPARPRFACQLAAVCFVVILVGGMPKLDLGLVTINWGFAGYVVGTLGILWLLNLYNFMDGIDGIAGVEAISAASMTGLIMGLEGHVALAGVCVTVAFAALGFLVWNWPPARIFLGDVGSGFLGFFFGAVVVLASQADPALIWPVLTLLGVFVADATFTLLRRVVNGERFYEAHRSHAYQHAARRWGHKPVTLAVGAINVLWLGPWALVACRWPRLGVLTAVAAYLPLVVCAAALGAGRPGDRKPV